MDSGFEAWLEGPVSPELWLAYANWNHPKWPDETDILVGDVLTDDRGDWVVLSIHLEQRGLSVEPTIRLGNPLTGPEEDDLILSASTSVTLDDEPQLSIVKIPSEFTRNARFKL